MSWILRFVLGLFGVKVKLNSCAFCLGFLGKKMSILRTLFLTCLLFALFLVLVCLLFVLLVVICFYFTYFRFICLCFACLTCYCLVCAICLKFLYHRKQNLWNYIMRCYCYAVFFKEWCSNPRGGYIILMSLQMQHFFVLAKQS